MQSVDLSLGELHLPPRIHSVVSSAMGIAQRSWSRAKKPWRQAGIAPQEAGSCLSPPTVGSFRLTALIHQGTHATIYRAASSEQLLGPGCYAIKTAKRADANAIGLSLLRREAAVLTQSASSHLPSLLANNIGDEQPHFALAYLEGATLRRRLQKQQSESSTNSPMLPLATALAIIRQAAVALEALHRAGWLHGQVRPEHLIVSPQGFVTLIDVSQSRRLESAECNSVDTAPSAPQYAAPECFARRGQLSAASDIYTLGIVLYELLSGGLPFPQADLRRLEKCHRTSAVPDLRSVRSDASLELAELLRRMLAKEPLRRPAAEDVVHCLTALEIEELASGKSLA
jgi:serine/threonine protein kinase